LEWATGFCTQGKAQLQAIINAKEAGIDITEPVNNIETPMFMI